MCRLFAQLSPDPRHARGPLVDWKFSLLRQADFDKANPQQDGWGVGWFSGGRARIEKSPKPAFAEPARVGSAAESGVSTAVVGHIRAASNPRGIPQAELINLANTQPFSDGRWLFAHNGTLQIPAEIEKRLGTFARGLESKNDSEVYFRQFLKHLDKTGDAAKAFEACVAEDWDAWSERASAYPEKKAPYSSLNAVVTDGRRLFAFCHSAAKGLAQCGVCSPEQPWQTMSYSERDGALLVASEDLDDGAWTRFSPPEVVSAEASDGRVRVKKTRYELELSGGRLVRKSEEEATLR